MAEYQSTSEIQIIPELQHSPDTCTTPSQELHIISDLFKSYVASNLSMNLPGDFLELAVAKVIGTMREDRSDLLLPAKHMPMGLIEHCINFFTSTHVATGIFYAYMYVYV